VLDGFDNDTNYHFNWGWSGTDNGYFILKALNPGTDTFNNGQQALIRIIPDTPATHATVDTNTTHTTAIANVGAAATQVNIYPNPANETIYISLQGVTASQIRIMDIEGRQVVNIIPAANESLINIPVSKLATGMYIVQLQTNNGLITRKISVL
jgi:hypothetical protein